MKIAFLVFFLKLFHLFTIVSKIQLDGKNEIYITLFL